MSDKVKVSITLKQDTINTIEEIVKYCKVTQKLENLDLPTTTEEFIKDSISFYLKRLERISSFVIDEQKTSLSKNGKLRNNLKQIMIDKGLKQKDLADRTNIDPSNISIILSNRNQPSIEYFLKIWVVLGCPPIEEVFYREEK